MAKSKWEKIYSISSSSYFRCLSWDFNRENIVSHGLRNPMFPRASSRNDGTWPGLGLKEGEVPNICKGERLTDQELSLLTNPMKFQMLCGKGFPKKLPDILPMYIPVISEKIKNVFDEFEPSIHQYHQIEFVDRESGHPLWNDQEWYYFNCLNWYKPDELFDFEKMLELNNKNPNVGIEYTKFIKYDDREIFHIYFPKHRCYIWNTEFAKSHLKNISIFRTGGYWPDRNTEINFNGSLYIKSDVRRKLKEAGVYQVSFGKFRNPSQVLFFKECR